MHFKDIKTLDEFAINKINELEDRLIIANQEITNLLSELNEVKDKEEVEEVKPLLLKPISMNIYRFDVESGYKIRDLVKEGKVQKELVLEAVEDRQLLEDLSKIIVESSWNSTPVITEQVTELTHAFVYEGIKYGINNLSGQNPNIIAYNTHLADTGARGSYSKPNTGYISLNEREYAKEKAFEELIQNIVRYEKEIEEVEVQGEKDEK